MLVKLLPSQIVFFLQNRAGRRNTILLLKFLLVLVAMVLFYGVAFHFLMAWEDRGEEFTWFTGIYWALTVMSTLGFGDITFHSDVGRLFAMIVLLSGMIFMLVLLPFTFIEFFYSPWMKAQSAARVPRELPDETKGHAILTHVDPVSLALVQKLDQYKYPYVLLVPDLERALQLLDDGYKVVVGELDHPDTWRRVRVRQAALVATTSSDVINTNVTFTVRELTEKVTLIATANMEAASDVLKLAGCNHVLRLGEMMGQFLGRRVIGSDALTHIVGRFDELLIAETTATGTPLVGKTLQETRLREMVGVTVVGFWDRGRFETARPETEITSSAVLVLAGSEDQFRRYDELFCIYNVAGAPVVVIGGGRVGRAAGRALKERGLGYKIVERLPERVVEPENYVVGNAEDIKVLEQAGLSDSPAVVITPHNDDLAIYLTILCRKLRPDIQIVSRAILDRNVSTLHRAGADIVVSYASMGANAMFNLLERGDILMVAEGLNVLRVKIPESLAGKTIAESAIRQDTGCTVVALELDEETRINPDPHEPMPAGADIIIIGDSESEQRFLHHYGSKPA